MTFVRARDDEACARQPTLAWDTIWVQRLDASGGWGDWVLAGPGDQIESRGGLRAEAALHTATLIQLFTDARAPDGADIPTEDGDRRGWWGDTIRLDGEPDYPLGSLIWLEVTRARLDDDTARRVEGHAAAALAVLKDQGAVARTDVAAEAHPERGLLTLAVRHFDVDGAIVYDQRFGVLWAQELAPRQMNFGDTGVFGR